MDNKEVIKKSKEFLRGNRLAKLTLSDAQSIIANQGYTIIPFNNLSNTDDVDALISNLGLSEQAKHSRGFTYADANFRLVFIHEGLSDEEKLLVLAHEEGHIYLNHMAKASVLGNDVQEEAEANTFAQYVVSPSKGHKCSYWIKTHKLATVLAAILAVAILAGASMLIWNSVHWTNYYITETGSKYHCEDCKYLKGKDNTIRLTRNLYRSGLYAPCEVCLPEQ